MPKPRVSNGSGTDRKTASHMSATLRSAVRLLTEARKALSKDNDKANQCIAKAAAILQA